MPTREFECKNCGAIEDFIVDGKEPRKKNEPVQPWDKQLGQYTKIMACDTCDCVAKACGIESPHPSWLLIVRIYAPDFSIKGTNQARRMAVNSNRAHFASGFVSHLRKYTEYIDENGRPQIKKEPIVYYSKKAYMDDLDKRGLTIYEDPVVDVRDKPTQRPKADTPWKQRVSDFYTKNNSGVSVTQGAIDEVLK